MEKCDSGTGYPWAEPLFQPALAFQGSLLLQQCKINGGKQRNFRRLMLAHGSCVERFNSSAFVYRDAQSRRVRKPAIAQSPLTSHSKDNLGKTHLIILATGLGGLDPYTPTAGTIQPIPLMA